MSTRSSKRLPLEARPNETKRCTDTELAFNFEKSFHKKMCKRSNRKKQILSGLFVLFSASCYLATLSSLGDSLYSSSSSEIVVEQKARSGESARNKSSNANMAMDESTLKNTPRMISQEDDKPNDDTAMRKALDCLRQTKPDLPDQLDYPQDALHHFHQIHSHLRNWAQHPNHFPHTYSGYSGPWIENHWITHFQEQLESKNHSLSDVFGPYIPIFIPWVDLWAKNRRNYPRGLALALKEVLREDVLYITVSQNAAGFVGRCTEFDELQNKYHITVLSSGGYGHVPIPLLKQPEAIIQNISSINERKYMISYVGSKANAPQRMRERMTDHEKVFYYYGKRWKNIMKESKFSLCPRGFGRTSFHIMEALQLGLVPIQVYIDIPWLPYENLLKNLSYAVQIDDFPDLMTDLSKMPDSDIERMEEQIKRLQRYFTFEGVMEEISKFMVDPTSSELVCHALPSNSGTPVQTKQNC